MKYKKLRNLDTKVSEICLGSMTWGEQNTEQEGHQQIDFAFDMGVNFIDTAEMYAIPPKSKTYGRTEEIIGTWFKKSKKRKETVLASKVVGAAPHFSWIRNGEAKLDRKNITLALEDSLRRLKTDYIDLYQLHWSNRSTYVFSNYAEPYKNNNYSEQVEYIQETLETIDDLIKQGKILSFGLSNETAWGTMKYLELAKIQNLPVPVTIQNEYNLACRHFEQDLAEVSIAENIGLLAWSPLVGGAISGKYLNGNMPKGSRRSMDSRKARSNNEATEFAIAEYYKIARDYNLDVCQMALKFALTRPFMASVIIGATSMEQLKTNIDSVNIDLSDEVLARIEEVHNRNVRPY